MATLLLRLAAPLQAWGIDSKFDTRKTGREPSKSGVIGLLAAALGYKRYETDKLASLNDLNFGVRTDREGKLLRDFHMAHSIEKDKNNEYKYQCLTQRYYLSDAVFLAGFEGGREKLEEIASAGSVGTSARWQSFGMTIVGVGRWRFPSKSGSHFCSAPSISVTISRISFRVQTAPQSGSSAAACTKSSGSLYFSAKNARF